MSAAALVIAAEHLMPALRERIKVEGEVITFPDTEPIQALQTIMEQRPDLVVLERLFAATPRGAALINRIKTDPQLANAEVRVMSHTGDYTRQVAKPSKVESSIETSGAESTATSVVVAPAEAATRPLDWHGTRRATRYRVRAGVEIQVD